MPPRAPKTSADAIVEAVARAAEGLGIEELQTLLPRIPRRTLQRRLAELAGNGELVAVGSARARRYHRIPVAPGPQPVSGATNAPLSSLIPLSGEGQALGELVRRPVAQRTPVGYHRAFLADYQPNTTAYLAADTRARLHRLGRSPVASGPAGTYARQIIDRLLIDLSWASSRLEGNTYSRLDTQNLIEFGHAAAGKDQLEAQMILNHKAAIEMLVDQAGGIGFNRYTVQNLHALLSENLLPDPGSGGRLRRIDVAISGSVFHPLAIPQQIEEFFDVLLQKADDIIDPFEQAFFAMVHLPYLQPFEDVNKRVSRLAANIPLIKQNLAPLSFVDVPEALYIEGTMGVYELNRIELLRDVFVWAYERSCQRYTVLRDVLPVPDPLRLRHRETLRELVKDIVTAGIGRSDIDAIAQMTREWVTPAEVEDVVAITINELHQLHEGNIARYRLRPSVFRAWQAAQQSRSNS